MVGSSGNGFQTTYYDLDGVLSGAASVDKPVVFHFLFGKIRLHQQGSEDDDKQPRHGHRVILKNNSASIKETKVARISSNTQPTNSPRQAQTPSLNTFPLQNDDVGFTSEK